MVIPLNREGGQASTTVRFSEPGTYVIRAVADDRIFTTPVSITVIVKGAVSTARP